MENTLIRLSIIAPAHNEEERLPAMLDAYLDYFNRAFGDGFELVVVVNGSEDRSEEIARDYAASHPPVRCLVEPAKIGKGGAVIMGFDEARGDLIGFVDADGATPPEAFHELAEQIGDAGCIIGSRWIAGSNVIVKQPLVRRLVSRAFNFLVRIILFLPITDTQCGAKVLTRPAVKHVLPVIGVTSWAFDVDLLFQLKRMGYTIKEWPTIWNDQKGSTLNVPKASSQMLLAIIRLRLIYSPLQWMVPLYDNTIGRMIKRQWLD